MAASYPGSLPSFTTKEDKVDLVAAAHINDVQAEAVAIATELGTDPAGSKTDVKTRLAVLMANNGAVAQGTSFPGSPVDGQAFYRTDVNVLYIYNGASWDSQGQSLSNVLFSFGLTHTASFHVDTSVAPNNPTANYASWFDKGSTYVTVILTKFKKFAGVSTVTWYAYLQSSFGDGAFKVDVGGQNSEVTTVVASLAWRTNTIDVSGLSDGTVYDVTISIKGSAIEAGESTHLYNIIAFAS